MEMVRALRTWNQSFPRPCGGRDLWCRGSNTVICSWARWVEDWKSLILMTLCKRHETFKGSGCKNVFNSSQNALMRHRMWRNHIHLKYNRSSAKWHCHFVFWPVAPPPHWWTNDQVNQVSESRYPVSCSYEHFGSQMSKVTQPDATRQYLECD